MATEQQGDETSPDSTPTRRVSESRLTWEQYCSRVGVDPHAARAATVTRALAAAIQRLDAALKPARVPVFNDESDCHCIKP